MLIRKSSVHGQNEGVEQIVTIYVERETMQLYGSNGVIDAQLFACEGQRSSFLQEYWV